MKPEPESIGAPRESGNVASRRTMRLVLSAGLVAVAVHLVVPAGRASEVSYLAISLGAGAAAWAGWFRVRGPMAALVAAGVSLSAAGDLTYQVLVWTTGEEPAISVGDIGWLGAYVAIGAALLLVIRNEGRHRLDVDAWIDIAAVTIFVLLLQWQLAPGGLISDGGSPPLARIVWALYPAFDSVLVALVVRAVLARRMDRAVAARIVGGSAFWFGSDVFFTVLTPTSAVTTWLNAGWLLGAVLLATAAWQPPLAAPTVEPVIDDDRRVGDGRIAVAMLPLALPGAIEIAGWLRGNDPNPFPLFAATVAFVVLAFLRASQLSRAADQSRALIRSRERQARTLAAHAADASVIVNADGIIMSEAKAFAALVGHPDAPTAGADVFLLVAPVDVEETRARFRRVARRPGESYESELRVIHRDGHEIWLAARVVNLTADPDVSGILINLHDITERRNAQDQLTHQAFHDGLTDLANRALFSDRVEHALRRNARTGLEPAVIFLDLDGFKSVNDALGHAAGDDLLREVARRLVAAVRPSDTVARLGGDEFAVLLEQSSRPLDEATTIADRILASLSAPVELTDQTVSISASLGIACGDPEATSGSLLREADVAMYRAKATGKGCWVVHDSEMRTAAVERFQLEADLLGALDAGQFALVYQPVVELESEAIVGFEALLRWHHPSLGVVMPDKFIPLAEDSGLIVPIGAWVLDEACRQAADWHRSHPEHHELTMSVNVSARQIASPDLLVHVAQALSASGLDPSRLVVEMTETALVEDTALAAERLHELRRLGIRLAIDDFGTGYSSLSYLRQFPVDILKIDRSFISSINDRDKIPAIVRGLLDLGRTLELATVAEGVEFEAQRDQLRDEHCEFAQGFLFAHPLEPADAELLLDRVAPRQSPVA